MSTKQFSRITSFLLLLTVFATATTALYSPINLRSLSRRQETSGTSCADYSRIANLTVVGSNATYRAPYLAASPEGSDPARAPLDAAIPLLPALQFDEALNQQCGNLTTIAYEGAEANFTNGIVLQFSINGASMRIGASSMGMAMLVAMVAAMVIEVV